MSNTAHVAPPSVSVTPGEEQRVVLHVRNGGDIVDSYRLTVVGETVDWVTVEPDTLSLYPGTEGTATLTFRPPRSSAVRAGERPYGVRVLPSQRPGEVVVPEGRVEVLPFRELDAEVVPPERKRRLRARFQVRVANRGNTPLDLVLALEQASEEIRCALAAGTLTLQPGEETYVDLTVRPRKLLWFGAGVPHPFAVRVAAKDEEEPVVPGGTYVQQPLLPRWLLALLALLLALIVLWFALALPAVRSAAREEADETVEEVAAEAVEEAVAEAAGGAGAAPPEETGGAGAGQEPGAGDAAGEQPGGTGGGQGTGSPGGTGGEGDAFATVLQTSLAPGESDTAVFQVPEDRMLLITDLLADAPQGDTGTLRVTINENTVTSLALENFRSHDNHWVTPIEAPPGSTIEMAVTCRQPGSPPDGPAPGTCEESLFVTGTWAAPR